MKECISLLSREFWLNGEIQTACCCMFIGFDDGSWLKALYNDETCCWELAESDETPNPQKTLGDNEFSYPYRQYLPVETQNIGELNRQELVTNNKLVLKFSRNFNLVLLHNVSNDDEYVEINT